MKLTLLLFTPTLISVFPLLSSLGVRLKSRMNASRVTMQLANSDMMRRNIASSRPRVALYRLRIVIICDLAGAWGNVGGPGAQLSHSAYWVEEKV